MIDKILLAPYRWTLRLRHLLYDKGALKSVSAPVPTISVGNVTVGGTGKTPHTEMLIRLLTEKLHMRAEDVAVLSRGYKRKSKGFRIVTADGTARMFGDEPLQIKKKFPEITVAVDKDRIGACAKLAEGAADSAGVTAAKPGVIILDDAMQYRRLKPSLSVCLVSFGRPPFKDRLLPFGRLRDIPQRISSADIAVVTKCPPDLDPWERRKWAEMLGARDTMFTSLGYGEPLPVFSEGDHRYIHSSRAIVVSGIADDRPLTNHLSGSYKIVRKFRFRDHHAFSKGDISSIARAAERFPTAIVITTEKDAERLYDCSGIGAKLKERFFKIPVLPEFLSAEDAERFAETVQRVISPRESRSES